MRTMLMVLLLIAGAVLLAGCTATGNVASENQVASAASSGDVREVTLSFEGMTCPSCALGVEYQLKQVDGVIDAFVNYPEGRGVITYDADVVSAEAIAQASDVYPATILSDK